MAKMTLQGDAPLRMMRGRQPGLRVPIHGCRLTGPGPSGERMTEQSNKPLVIGLAGFGTVGGGLARLLEENADIIRRRGGRDMVVK